MKRNRWSIFLKVDLDVKFDMPYLASEDRCGEYLGALKKAMLAAIKANKRIRFRQIGRKIQHGNSRFEEIRARRTPPITGSGSRTLGASSALG